jgi:hypothetical protein
VLPCCLSRICVSSHVGIKEFDAVLDGVVHVSFNAERKVGPPAVTDDYGAGYDTYIYIHIQRAITCTSRIKCWIHHDIAKLQYAIKSSTRLNDGEQYLGTVFSNRCKSVLSNSSSAEQRPTLSHAACHNYTIAS